MENPTHFGGKEATIHVVEKQADGILASAEVHGEETPGPIASFGDAARETAFLMLLIWSLFRPDFPSYLQIALFFLGWTIWKMGRSAWLGWSRLERLHRLVAEEKWEIDHHRDQEREELKALYEAKGFKGKLLDDVIEVLMADGDRLLRVMLEEELGLRLEKQEHPLKLALGSCLGALSAFILASAGYFIWTPYGLILGALLAMGIAAALSATYDKNRRISAIVWNISLAILAAGSSYFLYDYLHG